MAKKSKVKKNRKKLTFKTPSVQSERGFDFGFRMRVMSVPDIEFNQALRDAEIIGCAYGFHPIEGTSQHIPCITLVGSNITAFDRAYQCFKRWGCEEDGDVLDVDLLLKSDGSYEIWIGPEINQLLYRTIPQAELFESLSMNMSWIKPIDSTNKMLHEMKNYCKSQFHPVLISAAIGDPKNRTSLHLAPVPGWKGILKFNLHIIEQSDVPEDPRFAFIEERAARKQKKNMPLPQLTPDELCQRRIKAIDTAFPVSRERVRRSSLLQDVHNFAGFEKVTEIQVVQGAINLMISGELVQGDKHYQQMKGDVVESIWHVIASRVELADGACKPADQHPSLVARQIELDVRATFKQMKVRGLPEHFPLLQEIFLREGYVND